MRGKSRVRKADRLLCVAGMAGALTLCAGGLMLMQWIGPASYRMIVPAALPLVAGLVLAGGLVTGLLLVAALRVGRRRPGGGGPGGGEPMPLPRRRRRSSGVELRRAA